MFLIISLSVISSTCVDSDGKDYFQRGNVSGIHLLSPYFYNDSCIDAITLNEYYCNGGLSLSETYICPLDKFCSNGACVNVSCTGKPSCIKINQYICSKIQGCSWSADKCLGSPTLRPTCAGMPDKNTCEVYNCTWNLPDKMVGICFGSAPAVTCSNYNNARSACKSYGCNYTLICESKGKITYGITPGMDINGPKDTYTDHCFQNITVNYFCDSNGVTTYAYTCLGGQFCSNGKCCDPAYHASWSCESWGACVNGLQTRNCFQNVIEVDQDCLHNVPQMSRSCSNPCTDSDNGKNYVVKGTITLGIISLTDFCKDGSLIEYYCDGVGGVGGNMRNETKSCSEVYGKIHCTDGKCI